jgi:hypothetical protein
MNPKWFGDSFDIVKRFFIEQLCSMDYHVSINPMLTGDWSGLESDFYRLLKVPPINADFKKKSALFLDPDTGIGKRKTKKHITVEILVSHLKNYDMVFSFDQSFSFSSGVKELMTEKLNLVRETGNHAFYYDSHARFLFAAKSIALLDEIEKTFLSTGLPKNRFFKASHI